MVAHERLTEPRFTMESLLAKPRSFWNLPAVLDLKFWNLNPGDIEGVALFVISHIRKRRNKPPLTK